MAKAKATKARKRKAREQALQAFIQRLSEVTILDPACGSGNFLYVALHLLLDLEKEVITYAARYEVSFIPQVRPTQLAGIEVNEYAQELASVVIWIGYLQCMHHNGFNPRSNPVLEPIEAIRIDRARIADALRMSTKRFVENLQGARIVPKRLTELNICLDQQYTHCKSVR